MHFRVSARLLVAEARAHEQATPAVFADQGLSVGVADELRSGQRTWRHGYMSPSVTRAETSCVLLCYRCITASLSRAGGFWAWVERLVVALPEWEVGRQTGYHRSQVVQLNARGSMGDLVEIRVDGCIPRMSQQPELTTTPLAPNPAPAPGSAYIPVPNPRSGPIPEFKPAQQQDQRHIPQRIPRWLERAELFLRVLLRMYIGLAVCYAPWSRMFWDQNPLFVQFPTLSIYAANGAVRGIVSGLGLLNLWIAFHDALRHRDG